MAVLKIGNFTGIMPRMGKDYLPDNGAQVAKNTKLFSGELRSWMRPVAEFTPESKKAVSIYKMHGPGASSAWLTWDVDTDVVRGPVADAEDFRIYYSEDGQCRKTNWKMATQGKGVAPRSWLHMGVPAPTNKLTLTAERTKVPKPAPKPEDPKATADGEMIFDSENTENRVYVYTYVSTFGAVKEESAPSLPADIICDIKGHPVRVSGFENPPTDHYNITGIRLYRAVTGSTTSTYMLVDELELVDHQFPANGHSLNGVDWSASTYDDSIEVARLGKTLNTLSYTPPPEGLRGLVSMPNGFLAGFTYNQVWFSEPYLPYAWPADYMLTVDSQIVGLGVYGNTLVVCTKAQPYTISGTHPSSMGQEKQPMNQPCVSKQSIAYDQYGVLYASPHGIVALAGGQMDVFTRNIMTRDEWQKYSPSLMKSCMYNNLYMCSFHIGNKTGMLALSRGDSPALISLEFAPTTMHVEYGTGSLYAMNMVDHKVYLLDGSEINRTTYEWKSKAFTFNYNNTFTCAKVNAAYRDLDEVKEWQRVRDEVMHSNEQAWADKGKDGLQGALHAKGMMGMCINGSILQRVPEEADVRYATVSFYADDKLFYSKALTKPEAFRIPAQTGYQWEFRIAGTMDVSSLVIGTSMAEVNGS